MSTIKRPEKNIEMRSVTTEIISPRRFIEIQKNKSGEIKRAEFVRPKFGDSHYGKFRVTYKHPTFKQVESIRTKAG